MENFDFLMDHESLAGPYLLETAEGTRLMGIAGSLVEIEASVPTRNLAQGQQNMHPNEYYDPASPPLLKRFYEQVFEFNGQVPDPFLWKILEDFLSTIVEEGECRCSIYEIKVNLSLMISNSNKTIGCVDQQPCQNCGRPVLNEGICSRIFLFAGARGEPEVEVEVDVDVEESYEYSSDQDYDEESDTHVL